MSGLVTHTPGPWLWRGKSGSLHQMGTGGYTYGPAVLEPVYEYDSGADTLVSDANARLIAAAPELLDALKAIVDGVPRVLRDEGFLAAASAAIAKAEGRP